MKRVLIAIVVLVIVLVVSISSLFVLKNATDDLYSLTQAIETSVEKENYNEAKINIDKFTSYWNGNKHKLTVIVHLQNIENINDMVAMLEPLAKEKSKASLLVTTSRLKVLIEDLYENEFPFVYNIF